MEALIAGNDMLCLPSSVEEAITAIKKAIAENRLTWEDIHAKVKKVLLSKYKLGMNQSQVVSLTNLTEELNAKTDAIRTEVAQKSITILSTAATKASRTDYASLPLVKGKKIAYVGIGSRELNSFGKRMRDDLGADVFLFSYKDSADKAAEILKAVPKDGKYDAIVVGIHDYNNRPANNYNISPAAISLYKQLNFIKTVTIVFGNVLATQNFCDAYTLVAAYQDDNISQEAAADVVTGKTKAVGTLPVRVCNFKQGDGIVYKPMGEPVHAFGKLNIVDSIVTDAISQKAFPGCVVLAAHNREIIYHKAFGNYVYEKPSPMTLESIFDLASVTKISATTVSVMKLYEQGKLDLDKSWVITCPG